MDDDDDTVKITVIATGISENAASEPAAKPSAARQTAPKANFPLKGGQVSAPHKSTATISTPSFNQRTVTPQQPSAPASHMRSSDDGAIKIPEFLQRKK